MADGEPGIPERIEERVGEPGGGLAVLRAGPHDEADVDVRAERDGAAAEGADGGERDLVADPRAGDRRLVEPTEEVREHDGARTPETDSVLAGGPGGQSSFQIVPVATHCGGGRRRLQEPRNYRA